MSVPEMIYRGNTAFKKKIDRYFKTAFFPKGNINKYPEYILHLPELKEDLELSDYSIFGNKLHFNKPINWHRDIMNDREFPMEFSYSIDTRSGKNGNVKVVWEVNRLQFLSKICLKYIQSEDEKYLDQFMNIITSWKDANPYLVGVNWYSNIEVNIRIINWFLCWELLRVNELVTTNEKFKKFVTETWLPLIELHGMHAYRYESKYSSSNNHLIAEASGLFIVSSYWSFKDSPRWVAKGKKLLEREIINQHSSNGINKEEASEYIQFITDFFLIAYIVGERTSHKFSKTYTETLRKICVYISNLMDVSGHIPYYGDDDDGKVLSLELGETHNNFQSLLTSAAVLFEDACFKTTESVFDLKNEILFGQKGEIEFNKLPIKSNVPLTKLYQEEGHFLLKKNNQEGEIYLHIDVAPLGYLSIAAHGHADALSFFLHIDGMPYIIDPGTYTYHSYPNWRAYFKGTIAHNTIRVDGLDQSTNSGPCLWTDHYETEVLAVEDNPQETKIQGSHNGYNQIGISHTRNYRFDKQKDCIIIHDIITSNDVKSHLYELPLHLHPEIELSQLTENEYTIKQVGKRTVTIILDERLKSEVVTGSEDPIMGWYSPSFLQKEPTSVIYSKIELEGSFELKTEIHIN
ncbi:alginate lyase family protein [Maribacter sp. 2308TA10-17]|uniref:alginate lyase family protein n=1 Tax=Maribacter sp. 2308TA10-17 TaxID=3386276 RepID=UPI0039BD4260